MGRLRPRAQTKGLAITPEQQRQIERVLVLRRKTTWRMNADRFISHALERGAKEGMHVLTGQARIVFLISEAETLCEMEGIIIRSSLRKKRTKLSQ